MPNQTTSPPTPVLQSVAELSPEEFQRRRREAAEILADTVLALWLAEHQRRTEAERWPSSRGAANG